MPPEEEKKLGLLGSFLDGQLRPEKIRAWRIALFSVLAVCALLSLVVENRHPHFVYDAYPFFWAVFGIAVGVVLVFLVKKIIQPLIKKPEDYYGDL